MALGKIYYDPKHPAGFGSVVKLSKASNTKKKDVEEWLAGQDPYTLHKPVRKRFPRNPYTVTNIDDVWEMDLADLSSIAKHNDKYKFLLNVIDIFSRFAWSIPLKDKTGNSVTTALKSLFKDRKPITIQSDKGTEFVNTTVQLYLKQQGVQFHTTHNPDIKGAVIERFNRTLKTKMYRYFTRQNTFRYLDVIGDLLTSYNKSHHSAIGMAPSKVNPSNIYSVWQQIKARRSKIPRGVVKFKVGDHVRITKEKVKFAKGYEQTFSTEIFRVVKVIRRTPQPVYELSDLQDRPIEGQFYNYELVRVTVTPDSEFQIDKIVRTRTKGGIRQHLVKWRGYDETFNSWVTASDIKQL
jgi:transposase InsO family protein